MSIPYLRPNCRETIAITTANTYIVHFCNYSSPPSQGTQTNFSHWLYDSLLLIIYKIQSLLLRFWYHWRDSHKHRYVQQEEPSSRYVYLWNTVSRSHCCRFTFNSISPSCLSYWARNCVLFRQLWGFSRYNIESWFKRNIFFVPGHSQEHETLRVAKNIEAALNPVLQSVSFSNFRFNSCSL